MRFELKQLATKDDNYFVVVQSSPVQFNAVRELSLHMVRDLPSAKHYKISKRN